MRTETKGLFDECLRYAMALTTGVCLIAIGCGGNGLPMIPVSGVVTFDGGPPPAGGRITFTPTEVLEGLPRRPGLGRFDSQGTFVVSSFRDGDGLVPGTYKVKVSCLRGLPDVSQRDSTASVSYVAPGYEPDPLVVEKDSRAMEVQFDVPINPRLN
ncbi:hypothetical protein Pla108_38320 [Botrimarina colliarenosi]|uniref:Carboxypeptidase regulatory-like domain-containing protein n=1 Tax=Botrimarina colliarenosi TaxID=2528001 RepID=A0A5C6A3Z1_9BACT|nr:hypothetical protein Pla108_38320 [Botrimarina colliarenosi]